MLVSIILRSEKMAQNQKNNIKFISITGWILNILALFFIPVVFGIGGIIFGTLLIKNGEKNHGISMIIVAIIFAVLGVSFGYLIN